MHDPKGKNSETDINGWYWGPNLPHFDNLTVIQHVTFHLSDSLPKSALEQLEQDICSLPEVKQSEERKKRLNALIDAGYGSCILRLPKLAAMAENSILFFDGKHYHLFAWVVMPNHIHVLFQQLNGWTHKQIVGTWRRHMAQEIYTYFINKAELSPPEDGCDPQYPHPVWHRDYWDRYIRNEAHFLQVINYIHRNPVKAKLVRKPEDWQWGSARLNKNTGEVKD